jgi:hypothetical protein
LRFVVVTGDMKGIHQEHRKEPALGFELERVLFPEREVELALEWVKDHVHLWQVGFRRDLCVKRLSE